MKDVKIQSIIYRLRTYTAKLDERAQKSKRNNILTFGKEDLMSSMNQFHPIYGVILKPCGLLRGEGGFMKSPRKSTRGEGGLLVLSTWTKYTKFFRCIFSILKILFIFFKVNHFLLL